MKVFFILLFFLFGCSHFESLPSCPLNIEKIDVSIKDFLLSDLPLSHFEEPSHSSLKNLVKKLNEENIPLHRLFYIRFLRFVSAKEMTRLTGIKGVIGYTRYPNRFSMQTEIYITDDVLSNEGYRDFSITHELLHALGYDHDDDEYEGRKCQPKSLLMSTRYNFSWTNNQKEIDLGLTRAYLQTLPLVKFNDED